MRGGTCARGCLGAISKCMQAHLTPPGLFLGFFIFCVFFSDFQFLAKIQPPPPSALFQLFLQQSNVFTQKLEKKKQKQKMLWCHGLTMALAIFPLFFPLFSPLFFPPFSYYFPMTSLGDTYYLPMTSLGDTIGSPFQTWGQPSRSPIESLGGPYEPLNRPLLRGTQLPFPNLGSEGSAPLLGYSNRVP